ncbi:hypothetical protein ACIQMP_23515 [Streptomyces sp. NPDC091385]|uniref:hypothetical protein n=1 Tax=Streptomyces sp. NPDC091385 TaxID=3365997 RepID=UPI00380110F3
MTPQAVRPARPRSRALAALALTAFLVGGGTGCSALEDTARPDGTTRAAERLPADQDRTRSKANAREFRTWTAAHGTDAQKSAAARVDRIVGTWDAHAGNAYVATDIGGGRTPVADPQGAADAIAEAFASWKDSTAGFVSVYDVYGNAVVTNHRF